MAMSFRWWRQNDAPDHHCIGASGHTAANSAASARSHVVIIDGDTLKIDSKTIRIVEIDTPETFQSRCEKN